MLLVKDAAIRWLVRNRVWLGVGHANSMVMTFYLWNMMAAVLAAVFLVPTGLWPQRIPPQRRVVVAPTGMGGGVRRVPGAVPVCVPAGGTAAAPSAPAPRGWFALAMSVGGAIAIGRHGHHRRRGVPRAGRSGCGASLRGRAPGGRRPGSSSEPAAPAVVPSLCVQDRVRSSAPFP